MPLNATVARVPDILECHLMAGTADYLLKIVAEDTEDFARIHRQFLSRLPGVRQMQSSFALREVLQDHGAAGLVQLGPASADYLGGQGSRSSHFAGSRSMVASG